MLNDLMSLLGCVFVALLAVAIPFVYALSFAFGWYYGIFFLTFAVLIEFFLLLKVLFDNVWKEIKNER